MTHQPTHRLRPVAAASLVVLLSAGLAACTDSDAEPEPTPETSVNTASTPTASETPPVSSPTPESAEAFGRQVLTSLDVMLHTGASEEFDRLSDVSCVGCDGLMREADKLKKNIAAGLRVVGEPMQITSATAKIRTAGGATMADFAATTHVPRVEFSAPGEEATTRPAEDTKLTFVFRWVDGSWTITQVGA